jgi:hypothetical protein
MEKLSEPAAAPMLSDVGENAYVHDAPAACDTENDAPPMEMVPLRVEAVPLAAAV